MKKRKRGFTLIELLVVIAIIAMLLAILMPAMAIVKKIAARVVCATRLRGLGTAQTVYANENKDSWVVASFSNPTLTWNFNVAVTGWQDPAVSMPIGANGITVGASLYLLVRNADVSPKSFNCPASDQKEFSGRNLNNLDIVRLWDFGDPAGTNTALNIEGPKNCVSYSYHQPYSSTGRRSRYAVDNTRSSAFAAMADKNPWYDHRITNVIPGVATDASTFSDWRERVRAMGAHYSGAVTTSHPNVRTANAFAHDRESQNVMYADGHTDNKATSDVGVKNDNIYTFWANTTGTNESFWRQGNITTYPAANNTGTCSLTTFQPMGMDDSYLVSDDSRAG